MSARRMSAPEPKGRTYLRRARQRSRRTPLKVLPETLTSTKRLDDVSRFFHVPVFTDLLFERPLTTL